MQTITIRDIPEGTMLQCERGIWGAKVSDAVFLERWGYLPGEDEVPFAAILPTDEELWYVVKEYTQVSYLYEPEYQAAFGMN